MKVNNFQYASKLSHICDKFDTLLDELSVLSEQDMNNEDFRTIHKIYAKLNDRTNRVSNTKEQVKNVKNS